MDYCEPAPEHLVDEKKLTCVVSNIRVAETLELAVERFNLGVGMRRMLRGFLGAGWAVWVLALVPGVPAGAQEGVLLVGVGDAPVIHQPGPDGEPGLAWHLPPELTGDPVLGPDGKIYYARESSLYAAGSSGRTRCLLTAAGKDRMSPPTLDEDGVIYVAAGAQAWALHPDGRTNRFWTLPTRAAVAAPVLRDGRVSVALESGGVQVLDLDAAPPAAAGESVGGSKSGNASETDPSSSPSPGSAPLKP